MIISYGSKVDISRMANGTVVTVVVGKDPITAVVINGLGCVDCVLNRSDDICRHYVRNCQMRKIVKASDVMEEL